VTVAERLHELGIELPPARGAIASFEPLALVDGYAYVSGQLAAGADGELVATGRVGGEVDLQTAVSCARACALNVLAQLARGPQGLDGIDRLVKLTVFVASAPDFSRQHVVANGASDLLLAVLGGRGRHARSAIGLAALPLGSPVEVECIARMR
jgi:enamine deaminase RidA (YjgF/YER057c/UK114 family)